MSGKATVRGSDHVWVTAARSARNTDSIIHVFLVDRSFSAALEAVWIVYENRYFRSVLYKRFFFPMFKTFVFQRCTSVIQRCFHSVLVTH